MSSRTSFLYLLPGVFLFAVAPFVKAEDEPLSRAAVSVTVRGEEGLAVEVARCIEAEIRSFDSAVIVFEDPVGRSTSMP